MNERGICPVVDRGPRVIDRLSNFRQRTSQALIRNPEFAPNIMENAEETVTRYYAPVTAANPDFGNYQVTRTLRSIALSAAFFKGATFVMNFLGPELAAYNADTGEKPPFKLGDYFSPLNELYVFNFQTPQCTQFVTGVTQL